MPENQQFNRPNPWWWVALFAVLSLIIIAIWFALWGLITRGYGNPDTPGNFGDMFGAANALFSGLAFAGVVVAIFMQRRELELQREEVTRSGNAQESQADALIIAAQINAEVALLQNMDTYQAIYGNQDGYEFAEARIDGLGELLRRLRDIRENDESRQS